MIIQFRRYQKSTDFDDFIGLVKEFDASLPAEEGRLEKAIDWYQTHFLSMDKNYISFVAHMERRGIVGFVIGDKRIERSELLPLQSTNPTYVNPEIDSTHIYVAGDSRGKGFGKMLLTTLIEDSRDVGHQVVVATAKVDNPSHSALYRALGFQSKLRNEEYSFSLKL